jgi:2-oxo-3-hexenedioate decarboxylase/2-keto-4-pentenoate hydratase
MFQANTWHGRHVFTVPPRGRLGVECEIAVRMAADLPRRETPYELADMPAAVAASMAAIEVVQDRYVDYESIRPQSLRDVTAAMTINGLQVGRGTGTDILGEPLQVLCWLANNAAAWGSPLLANDPLGEVAADFTARPS